MQTILRRPFGRASSSQRSSLIAKVAPPRSKHTNTSERSFSSSASLGQSRGALAGGFSKENLADWAKREWGDVGATSTSQQPDHYVDLHSAKISGACAAMLEEHSHPSSAVGRTMFQSNQFTPERWIWSALMPSSNRDLPEVFQRTGSYLVFHVTDVTPHELIFKWTGGRASGCTMVAVDPRTRRIYLGSGIKSASFLEGTFFRQVLTPLHIRYSRFLLQGAVEQLERQAETKKDVDD